MISIPKEMVEEAVRQSESEARYLPGCVSVDLGGRSCLAIVAGPTDYTRFVVALAEVLEEFNSAVELLNDTTLLIDTNEVFSSVNLHLIGAESIFTFMNVAVVE